MSSKSFGNKVPDLPHLVRGSGGLSGEIKDLREDIEEAFETIEAPGATGTGLLAVDEYTNPATAATNGLEAATATTVAPRTVTVFEAAGLAALADAPRRVTFTTAGTTEADAPATAVITGEDVDGNVQTETVNIAQTATTVSSTKFYAGMTTVAYAAADGTDATVAIGFGAALGFRSLPKVRAGINNILAEIEAGVKVATGTFYVPTGAEPYGGYLPSNAPNGTRDYAVTYERDLS